MSEAISMSEQPSKQDILDVIGEKFWKHDALIQKLTESFPICEPSYFRGTILRLINSGELELTPLRYIGRVKSSLKAIYEKIEQGDWAGVAVLALEQMEKRHRAK